MTPDEMAKIFSRYSRQLATCCGPVYLKYVPGCTFATCAECKAKAVPDWDPKGACEAWNRHRQRVES